MFYKRSVFKNSGLFIVGLTFFISLLYTALDLDIIILDGWIGIMFRLIGIFVVVVFGYLPYYFAYKVVDRMYFQSPMLLVGTVLLVGDIFVRINVIIAFFPVAGFADMIVCSLLFFGVIGVMWFCDALVRRCIVRHKICYKFGAEIP